MFQPPFLEKEAAKLNFLNKSKNVFLNPKDVKLDATDTLSRLDDKAIKNIRNEEMKDAGNGLFGDVALWGVGLFSKDKKNQIINKLNDFKGKVVDFDERMTGKALEKMKAKPGGLLHKSMSVKKPTAVAETTRINPDGTTTTRNLYDIESRKPSSLALFQNTAKVSSPLLASAFVAEKMYPMEEQMANVEELEFEKQAIEEELMTERMDKVAALQKVSELEDRIDEFEGLLKVAEDEKRLFEKVAKKEYTEKVAMMKEKEKIASELSQKEKEFNELFLRMKSKERSGHAVKIAETLLEKGFIKQAEFDNKVDFLMDCDSETFNLYNMMSKGAGTEEKGLESSPFFIDYISREETPYARKGLSKRGQTIGEAALDLQK